MLGSLAGCTASTNKPDACAAAERDFEQVATEAEATGAQNDLRVVRMLSRIVVNNPQCFSAREVAGAQEWLEKESPTESPFRF